MTLLRSCWKITLRNGAIGGLCLLALALVGMIESFHNRYIIANTLTMGITLLLAVGIFIAYRTIKQLDTKKKYTIFTHALSSGMTSGSILSLLLFICSIADLRSMMINASPDLCLILNAGISNFFGSLIPMISGALCGLCAGALYCTPKQIRQTAIVAILSLLLAGMLQNLIRPMMSSWGKTADALCEFIYTYDGLTFTGAILILIIAAALHIFWSRKGEQVKQQCINLSGRQKRTINIYAIVLLILGFILLPHVLGLFLSEVAVIVGRYILLGIGLNIVVGYAGMLDLGYVAFFAIGSYTTAVLTSPEIGTYTLTFWQALPVAIIFGVISGVLLGIPVLKMRGDYLAIATLGFGEIISVLVLSDFLKPWLGGAQGIKKIPGPVIHGFLLKEPQHFYYLIFAGCLLVAYISFRLRDSRIGRAWMAIREDEDVAQAMGINLVTTKLLAFATGAGFSALSGAIFASKIGSVFPISFDVYISLYILCLVIVGGIGSFPGVIIGALALMGLPELLREFDEYRMLIYGIALVGMMLTRPEGLWPESRHKNELHSSNGTRQ